MESTWLNWFPSTIQIRNKSMNCWSNCGRMKGLDEYDFLKLRFKEIKYFKWFCPSLQSLHTLYLLQVKEINLSEKEALWENINSSYRHLFISTTLCEAIHCINSGGSRISPGGGWKHQLIIWLIFPENCMKINKVGPDGGECVPRTPRSATYPDHIIFMCVSIAP